MLIQCFSIEKTGELKFILCLETSILVSEKEHQQYVLHLTFNALLGVKQPSGCSGRRCWLDLHETLLAPSLPPECLYRADEHNVEHPLGSADSCWQIHIAEMFPVLSTVIFLEQMPCMQKAEVEKYSLPVPAGGGRSGHCCLCHHVSPPKWLFFLLF